MYLGAIILRNTGNQAAVFPLNGKCGNVATVMLQPGEAYDCSKVGWGVSGTVLAAPPPPPPPPPQTNVTTNTNVTTQVSPQISPSFVQQSNPSDSPVSTGAISTPSNAGDAAYLDYLKSVDQQRAQERAALIEAIGKIGSTQANPVPVGDTPVIPPSVTLVGSPVGDVPNSASMPQLSAPFAIHNNSFIVIAAVVGALGLMYMSKKYRK